ncbi:response regulator [Roseateles flavus]|uniref:Response regulator n=1 Tax=Roseateles flavus TaxID=3149041 RepID=A0ABV0GGR9_9BURK
MNDKNMSEEFRRVLIVDDSRAIQAIIRRVLQHGEMGPLQIQTASDGAEALQRMQEFKPDLVVSDWHMPGVSGIEMLQTLRQIGQGHVPVGFVTTETNAQCLNQARSNGAAFVVHKPFDDATLRRVVHDSLYGQSALREQAQQRKTAEVTEPATVLPGALQSLGLAQQHLHALLCTRSFDLLKSDARHDFEQYPLLVGLYGCTGRKTAYAVGLLDASAVAMIGGMALALGKQEILRAIQTRQPSPRMVEEASRYLRSMAAVLHKPGAGSEAQLGSTRLTPQPFDKLQQVLQQPSARTDLSLTLPLLGKEAGTGRLCFLLV